MSEGLRAIPQAPEEAPRRRIACRINGRPYRFDVDPRDTLLEVLRQRAFLVGAKEGCGVGVCGSCTVIVDGRPVSACTTLAALCDGADVLTIEGLAQPGPAGQEILHPLQEAFLDQNGFQCGYCTSGMIMACLALLQVNPDPSEAEIRDWLSGNLCRCGAYTGIVAAVRQAAATLRTDSK